MTHPKSNPLDSGDLMMIGISGLILIVTGCCLLAALITLAWVI